MTEENTRQVNRIAAYTLFACTFVIIALLGLDVSGNLHMDKWLKYTIGCVGAVVTISPLVLLKLKVNDTFLKYYILIVLVLFIGVLGTSNGIGIYISFALAPIVSCLYFDPKLTKVMGWIAYIVMVLSVFINSAGKMEITYYGWTHFHTFFLYIAGFTLEYTVVALFLFHMVNRAKGYMDKQKAALEQVRAEEYKHRVLAEVSRDIIFEYNPEKDVYSANRSIYSGKKDKNESVVIEEFMKKEDYSNGECHELKDVILSALDETNEELSFYRELDCRYVKDGKTVYLWYELEGFVIKDDNNKIVGFVGRLKNITHAKNLEENNKKFKVSNIYKENGEAEYHSIHELLMNDSVHLDEEDMQVLAQSHNFVAEILDDIIYSRNADNLLDRVLDRIGIFFGLERIAIITKSEDEHSNKLLCQWSKDSRSTTAFDVDINHYDVNELENYLKINGYLEYNGLDGIDSEEKSFVKNNMKTNQLWLPTLDNGSYTGAVYFGKSSPEPFSVVEKCVFADVVNTLSAYINQIKAEKANKAKSMFLSNMSHEIRTPMNAIMGMAEVALREDMTDEMRKNLNIIKSSASGLLGIINEILDFSKIESGRIEIVPEKYEICSLLNDTFVMIETRNKGNKLDISFDAAEDMPVTLEGDVVRIRQIMLNFATNAIKYTDEGAVNISVSCSRIDDSTVALNYKVKDTGMGIKEEDLDKLFRPFNQVDVKKNHHKEGTGLGLAICKQLVDIMGGSVDVQSVYGEGSTFAFTVPQKVVDWTPAGKVSDYKYDYNSEMDYLFKASKARVLIVDDNEINLDVSEALFEPIGMHIDKAKDGIEAVSMVRENEYDLIMMDYFMPVMDGVEATKIIREMTDNPNQNIPIIALTADAVSGVKEKLTNAGMNDFISKPVDIKAAYYKIKYWLPDELIENA